MCLSTLILGRCAELREEQLAALRRRQREKERVAAAQEAQRKARREAEAEERAAQIKARRSAEAQARAEAEAEARARAIEKARAEADADAEERAAIRRLKARTALAGSRNLEAEADGRLQTERRLAGVSTNPPSATSPHPSTTAHPSPKTPAKSKPGFRVVSSGGWRTWEAEGKATSVVQSINVKENTTAEGSRHPGVPQIQTSSSPVPAASVLVPATHGVDRDGVAWPVAGWRQREAPTRRLVLERPLAASKAPSKGQSSSSPLPATNVPISTKDEVTSLVPEINGWRPKRLQGTSGPPAHSQTTEVMTSIWRPKHVPGK